MNSRAGVQIKSSKYKNTFKARGTRRRRVKVPNTTGKYEDDSTSNTYKCHRITGQVGPEPSEFRIGVVIVFLSLPWGEIKKLALERRKQRGHQKSMQADLFPVSMRMHASDYRNLPSAHASNAMRMM